MYWSYAETFGVSNLTPGTTRRLKTSIGSPAFLLAPQASHFRPPSPCFRGCKTALSVIPLTFQARRERDLSKQHLYPESKNFPPSSLATDLQIRDPNGITWPLFATRSLKCFQLGISSTQATLRHHAAAMGSFSHGPVGRAEQRS